MRKLITTALAIASATLLYSCGGDSSSPVVAPPPPAPTTLDGVVATGAVVVGASVVVKDSDAATADVTTTTSATGTYFADVSGLKAPFVVIASGMLNGETVQIVALVPSVTSNLSNVGNVGNVTSSTNAIAALVAPASDVSTLNTPATLAANATSAKVDNASNLIVNTLRTDPVLAAKLGTGLNPLTTVFTANGSGIDSVLDQLEIVSNSAGVSISNLAAPIAADGAAAAPVLLTAAQSAAPTTVPTLPSSSLAGTLPTAAEMTALFRRPIGRPMRLRTIRT